MKGTYRYGLSIATLLALWWVVSFLLGVTLSGPRSGILPGPLEALSATVLNWPTISKHLLYSSLRLVTALILAVLAGASLGIIIGFEDFLNTWASPLLYVLYPIPKVVFLPLVLVLLGISNWARIAFIFLVVVFQVMITARDSAKNLSREWKLTVRSAGGGRADLYRHVVVPACLPAILSSTRISIGLGIAALYLAESSFTQVGLGQYINSSWELYAYPQVFAGILMMGMLGLVLYMIIDLIERAVCKWQYL